MALPAGNIGFRIAGRPRFLVFAVPWMRKNNGILCLKGREYSSSVPVRYVPKKSSRVKESEDGFPRKRLEKNELRKSLVANDELRNEVVRSDGRGVKGSVVLDEKFQNQNRNEISSKKNVLFDDDAKQVEKLRNQNRNEISYKNNLDDDAKQVEKLQIRNQSEIPSMNNLLFDGARQVEKLQNRDQSDIPSKNNLLFDDDAKQVEKLQNRDQSDIPSMNNLLFDDDAKQVEKLQNRDQSDIPSTNNLLFDDDAKQVEKLQNQDQSEIPSMNNLLFDDDANQEFEEENHDSESESVDLVLMEELGEVIEEPEESFEEMEIPRGKCNFELKVSLAGKCMQDAENLAIKLLAKRAFTVVELRKKLNGTNFPPDIVEAVLKDFQSRGLINDSLYAETYSRSRWSSSSWGPRRIKQALFIKGVSNSDAEKAVNLVFNDVESNDEQESKHGMSKLSMDHLFVQASKQWLRSQDAPKETRKVRIIRWLQYRGFNWGVTNFILKKLESQYPV